MNLIPYSNASIIGKKFRRKANHSMLSIITEMTDVVSGSKKHIEIVKVEYDTYYDGVGSIWWEINHFNNEWEELSDSTIRYM